jgi:hypothetical protein
VTSIFAWLDHDESERRKMLEVVNLFREKGTLDELGIGTIRDSFGDHFFPGTSTIQTRAKYFLFLPWIFQGLEAAGVRSDQVDGRARRDQARLAAALQAGGEGAAKGVIGIDAGERLQRPPSVVYWAGLHRWGILTFSGSLAQYYAALDLIGAGSRQLRSDDGDAELVEVGRRNWHGGLPTPPSDFLETTTFAVTREEASYLQERIFATAPDSLLAHCVRSTQRLHRVEHVWELPFLDRVPQRLRDEVEHARLFALVMHGAGLAYNLMLAEKALEIEIHGDATYVDRYRGSLEAWAAEMASSASALQRWDRSSLWAIVHSLNPRLRMPARLFAERWMTLALDDPVGVADNPTARQLLANRERALKGSLARLANRRALERWSGASGIGRLSYRWPNARVIVSDILDGLRQPAPEGKAIA